MDIGIQIWTWFRGNFVGQDEFGNRYYEHKKADSTGKKRRWVKYKGWAEASKIPAQWHGWLHYSTDQVPQPQAKYFWERPHQQNLTGTAKAYYPLVLVQEQPVPLGLTKSFYTPWTPSNP